MWICVDRAAKFTVGHVWAEGQQSGNIDGSRVLEPLQERWISVFGQIHTLRTDPEGAWPNKEVHERLSHMQVVLDLQPGEALWQASVTDNTVGIVKDTMTSIALERPDLKSTEVLAHHEMILRQWQGFSLAPSFRARVQGMESARNAWLIKHSSTERLNESTPDHETGFRHI